MEPKPRHRAFYLDPTQQGIAGRKFYFHQPSGIQKSTKSGYNQHIKPIDKDSQFTFSLQFTNLEDIEFQTLLYAIVLEQNMRHKLGYGKPAGLGSVRFDITKLEQIDFASRYTTNQGVTEYTDNSCPTLATYIAGKTRKFTNDHTSQTLNALRRIWKWNRKDTTTCSYPGRGWFSKKNRSKRISDTP